MNIDSAADIYERINGTTLSDLKNALIKAAVRYARIRTDWKLLTLEERKEADRTRSLAHNVLIDSCNILSRNMMKAGEDISWRMILTDNREEIGDFACYLHCILGIEAR